MRKAEDEIYDDVEATPEEVRSVVWTVISVVTFLGILVSITVAIIL